MDAQNPQCQSCDMRMYQASRSPTQAQNEQSQIERLTEDQFTNVSSPVARSIPNQHQGYVRRPSRVDPRTGSHLSAQNDSAPVGTSYNLFSSTGAGLPNTTETPKRADSALGPEIPPPFRAALKRKREVEQDGQAVAGASSSTPRPSSVLALQPHHAAHKARIEHDGASSIRKAVLLKQARTHLPTEVPRHAREEPVFDAEEYRADLQRWSQAEEARQKQADEAFSRVYFGPTTAEVEEDRLSMFPRRAPLSAGDGEGTIEGEAWQAEAVATGNVNGLFDSLRRRLRTGHPYGNRDYKLPKRCQELEEVPRR